MTKIEQITQILENLALKEQTKLTLITFRWDGTVEATFENGTKNSYIQENLLNNC